MARVAAFGDVNVDMVMSVGALPEQGEEAFAADSSVRVGGSAANTAAVLATLGIPAAVIGQVGADALGRTAIEELETAGVTTTWVHTSPAATTGMNLVVLTPDGERTMLGARGANAGYDRPVADWAASVAWLHLSAYSCLADPQASAASAALEAAAAAGMGISIDVPTGVADELGEALVPWLGRADMVALGRSSADRLGGPERLARDSGTVAVTGGGGPVTVLWEGGRLTVAPPVMTAIDSTGAGDAFAAGLVAGRLAGLSHPGGAVLAMACGAAATQTTGAGPLVEPETVMEVLDGHAWPGIDHADITAARMLLSG